MRLPGPGPVFAYECATAARRWQTYGARGVAVAGCALALALSVWGNRPHEVLLATYLVGAVLLLALPVWQLLPPGWGLGPAPAWLEKSNPFWLAFAPYMRSGGAAFDD